VTCVVSLLRVNCQRLVDIMFADDFSSRLDSRYDVVLFSFCRLWSKLIKVDSHRSDEIEACSSCVVDSTNVLLTRLTAGCLPALCRDKCLSVLLRCVDGDAGWCSPVRRSMLTAAHRTLSALYTTSDSTGDVSRLLNCCLVIDHHHNHTGHIAAHRKQKCATVVGLETQESSQDTTATDNCPTAGATDNCPTAGATDNCPTAGATADVVIDRPRVTTSTASSAQDCLVSLSNGSFCSSVQHCPSSCSIRSFSEEPCDDREAVCYDAKLVRKFVLLVLRSLDIVAREPADQRDTVDREPADQCKPRTSSFTDVSERVSQYNTQRRRHSSSRHCSQSYLVAVRYRREFHSTIHKADVTAARDIAVSHISLLLRTDVSFTVQYTKQTSQQLETLQSVISRCC